MKQDEAGSEQMPNLMGVSKGGGLTNIRDWGYTVGLLAGRSEIATPSRESINWATSAKAQRATQQSYFVVALLFLSGLVLLGIRRWPEFWSRIPEERAYYWPGRQADNSTSEPEGVELEGQDGGVEE